jgi:helicase
LAIGVDLPAFRAVLKDLRRYGKRGLAYIPVLEYLQMAGRAGRPKFDKYGEAICIAGSEGHKDELIEKYIQGSPEEIYSKLAVEPVLRTYVLSLIAANFVNTKKEIFDFFAKTFWAYQFADTFELHQTIEKMLGLLSEWEFLRSNKDDFVSADSISDERYKATLLGKRVAELYIDPLTAHNFVLGLRKATGQSVIDFSFLQMISSSLELRPLLRVKVKEHDKIQEELIKHEGILLEEEPNLYEPEYKEFINSIKTALFFLEWINEKDEEYLLLNYDVRPGEINVKLNNADWLLYTCEELCRIMKFQSLLKDLIKLRFRVKKGVKEELIPLLKLDKIGRVRARRLYANKIKSIGDVKSADFMKLVQILGRNVALNVKAQVGEDYSKIEVKENKRKGQISLKDF